MNNYVPRRGSAPRTIIAWLRTQPTGSKFKCLQIAVNCDLDERVVSRSLVAPVRHGIVDKVLPPGRLRPAYYRLAGHEHESR